MGGQVVRAVLDMGAMSARRHNPVRKAFADRLAKAGKAGKVIITAVARKRVVIADAILQTNRPRQPQVARQRSQSLTRLPRNRPLPSGCFVAFFDRWADAILPA